MANESTSSQTAAARPGYMPYLVAILLVGLFAMRVLTPAHEYAMRSEQVLTMALDVMLLIGVLPIRTRLPPALYWCAIVAGIGSLLIRFTSDAAWWTGHLTYSLN